MPKRTDIKKILIVGAGPIVIGQACEFDYSGTQACKALKEEGYQVILINSNPATIMTDPEFADRTYIEPINAETIEKIIEIEKPDAILPTVGGQTALNVSVELAEKGILAKHHVEMIGAKLEPIKKAEDRDLFKQAMKKIGLNVPESKTVYSVKEAKEFVDAVIGYPAIVRPAFTLGGTGSGIAYDEKQLKEICSKGLAASSIGQVLIEKSVIGWKEYEYEVMRDKNDNVVIICSIENLDPMGVHTGDSITVAPIQTLTDKEFQILRDASIAVIREIGVDTGGSNVQFAVNPKNGEFIVIEMNPRVSRSSALASKATGFPIAKIAAKLAVGLTLDEIPNDITKKTPSSFEPTIDYVVTKIPRFAFEKFPKANAVLGTQMKSVGEVMAIGRTFQESMVKAMHSMEQSRPKLEEITDETKIDEKIKIPGADRLYYILHAFRRGYSLKRVQELSNIDPWFLHHLKDISNPEIEKKYLTDEVVYKKVDTCAAEFDATTPYYYSTVGNKNNTENEKIPSKKEKIMILGGGPNRIGQGIEFDYCCVHASYALKDAGFETIMVNCNPETVSTDYDTSDRLYFEPLTLQSVENICRNESPKGIIVHYGGQTPLKLSTQFHAKGLPIIGTSSESIDIAEDRRRFSDLMDRLKIMQPENGTATNVKEAIEIATRIGYPVLVRPSYVLGGRAMEIVFDEKALTRYLKNAVEASPERPVLIDRFLAEAFEVDVDCLSDGTECLVAGVMEHIEYAGVHSGDSACVLPPYSLPKKITDLIKEKSKLIAMELKVIGLMNIQWAVKNDELYMIEVNPRASRTIPFVSKATGIPWAKMGALVMAGRKIKDLKISEVTPKYYSVKEVVLPFSKFPGQDIILGPEMRSTGEVMGIDPDVGMAFAKATIAAGEILPAQGKVFISCNEGDKNKKLVTVAKKLETLGFEIVATKGTAKFLNDNEVKAKQVHKRDEGTPDIVDMIQKGEIAMVINTPANLQSVEDDYYLRFEALKKKVLTVTTVAAAQAMTKGIEAFKRDKLKVKALQDYYKN